MSPEHRGPIELTPYLGWQVITTSGLGARHGGDPMFGLRGTVNFGHDSEFGVDVDWHFTRPKLSLRRDVTNTGGGGGGGATPDVAVADALVSMNWVEASFTYRIRQLRVEYLTPYVSIGAGAVILDAVSKTPIDANTGLFKIREPIKYAPVIAVALGIDYKLDPNWSLHAELRDEVFFTDYNDRGQSTRILNAASLAFGVTWAFD